MKNRIIELDYLKGVLILIMVIFHLKPIEDGYPLCYAAVYTFHMPAFLIISGYLANVEKSAKDFSRGMMRLIVPYVLFSVVYIVMLFFIGQKMHARNTINELSITSVISKIFTHPQGPYWYLHTLIISTLVYYLSYRILKLQKMAALVITGVLLYGLTLLHSGLSWSNAMYFLLGIYIFRSCKTFTEMISPSYFALLALVILFSSSDNYNRGSLAGVVITLLVISFLLATYSHCPHRLKRFFFYTGRNSLSIVVFAPIFTATSKIVIPIFRFDPTAICYTIFALSFTVTCCMLCAWLSDKLHISKYIFCRERIYMEF